MGGTMVKGAALATRRAVPGAATLANGNQLLGGPSIRVSKQRLEECQRSADYWTDELPKYANKQQNAADRFAIASGVIAAITGASVYPVAENVTDEWLRFALLLPLLLAAVLAVWPQVKNYGEMAGRARELASAYGPSKGKLLDGIASYETASDETLSEIVREFEALKAKKDQLRNLPTRPQGSVPRPSVDGSSGLNR